MRRCPRGHRRSVDRGAHRPAIEPRKYPHPGCRRRPLTEGNTDGRDNASAQTARRGLRHWHVRTLFAREPGDLMVGQRQHACCTGPVREGEEPWPTMYDHEKSDPAIVAVKPTNKAGQPAAELA